MKVLVLAIFVPYLAGIVSFVLFKRVKKIQWGLFFLNSVFHLYTAYRLYGTRGYSESISAGFTLFGVNNLALVLQNTSMGYLFFTASIIVTFLIALFSLSFNDREHSTGIAPLWTILMGANAGIFFAGDWITFLVSWEVMGWTSYFIIAHGRSKSRKAALYYYILSLIGTSTLLSALFITLNGSGSLLLKDGLTYLSGLWGERGGLVTLVALFLTVTFFSKSAVFPFYMWPSKAHAEAPDDFSAFLSGVMIKYGVFGLISIMLPIFRVGYSGPMINGVPIYLSVIGWLGAVTAVVGTLYAIPQDDMKKLMAYSTVSNIGYILAALSMNSSIGITAALFHTMNHMVFKGGIFLSMAAVKYRTGEREMHRLGGMAYRMPISFFTFLICIIAAAGIPPMSGFASKWMVFQSIFDKQMLILTIPIFFASTGSFLYLYRGLHTIYLGQLSPRFSKIKEAPPLMSFSMLMFMFCVFLVGFFPGLVLSPIGEAVASSGMERVVQDLSMIQGVTTTLNLTSIGIIFMGSVFIVLILYGIGKKRRHVEPLDTYTAGEAPEDWGLTAEKYHYGMHFYEPFEVMFDPFLRHTSFDTLFQKIGYETERFSHTVKRWFNSPQLGTLLIALAVILILAIWSLK